MPNNLHLYHKVLHQISQWWVPPICASNYTLRKGQKAEISP